MIAACLYGVLSFLAELQGDLGPQDAARLSLEVRVTLTEKAPALPVIRVDKNVEHCGETISDPILVSTDCGVKNAVVWIDYKGPRKEEWSTSGRSLSLQVRGCLFLERIQVAPVNSMLLLSNGDPLTHNPHGWWNDTRTAFNITMPQNGPTFQRQLRKPGIYRIDCDTHTWIKAYVHVFDHPYFALTDEKGRCKLRDVPPGDLTVRVWHEVLGTQTQFRSSTAEGTIEFAFELADRRAPKLIPTTVAPWPPGAREEQ